MSSTADDNRFAPPAAHVEDISAPGELVLGGRGARLGAVLIDVVIALLAVWIVTLLTPWSPYRGATLAAAAGRPLAATLLLNVVFGFGLFVAVHGYLLATRGQTIGKLALGLRIVRTDGSRATFGRLIGLRYGVGNAVIAIPVVGGIYGLVDALLIFRNTRKCLHDNIADTIVVKA